jgi:hypothetical protein
MDFNDFVQDRKEGGTPCTALVKVYSSQMSLSEFSQKIMNESRVICLLDPATGKTIRRHMGGHDLHLGAVED